MNVDEIIMYQPTSSVDENEKNEAKYGQKDSYISSILSASDSKNKYNFLDDNWVHKMILQFDRKLIKNQEQRIKYANEPTNFLSECHSLSDLFDFQTDAKTFEGFK